MQNKVLECKNGSKERAFFLHNLQPQQRMLGFRREKVGELEMKEGEFERIYGENGEIKTENGEFVKNLKYLAKI